ncbi:hypothetical protein D3C83_210060 [compost metagenome]
MLLASHTLAGTSVPAESGFVAAFWVSVAGSLAGALAALLVAPRRRPPLPDRGGRLRAPARALRSLL